jgi:quercetin dioxygenase-like cupin family protein
MSVLRTLPAALALCAALSGVLAQEAPPVTAPDQVAWKPLAPAPGVDIAFLAGAADKPGLYELRVRMAPGSVIAPHTHPDTRYFTILSGDLYAGVGPDFKPETARKLSAGSFMVMQAGVPHYVLAKDGPVVFQDSGIGPTGTQWLKK